MEEAETKKRNSCPTRLLADDPSQEDALGGGHERTARALADLVLNENGGKAVALLGRWGSGKSTAIRLFQKAVEKNQDIKVFVYDAWSHEGDPLRRTFLERIASFLQASDWIKGRALEEIKNQIDELAGRREVTESHTSTIVTSEGKWIGTLFALGVPLGAALLSSQPAYLAPPWFTTFGLLAVLSPFLAAAGFAIRSRLTKGRWEFPSLVSQNVHTTKTSTLRTPEPTSVEFEARFRAILNKALNGNRKLVIVIDNLDRLPDDQARSVWAVMRSFFDVGEGGWSDRLWLIVPFDPLAVSRLWVDGQANSAEVFVSKFFQARFYVPPPVLSDWKTFFFGLLRGAFPSHNEEDFYAIYKIYRAFSFRENSQPPTPRYLKQFVNQVGSQHRIWQDNISLPLQALYLVLRKELIEDPRSALANKDTESKVEKILPGNPKWKAYLLAQHFNVIPERALQVLYLDDIRKGLEDPRGSTLHEVAQQLEPRALSTLIHEGLEEAGEWAEEAPENLAKATLSIMRIAGVLPEADLDRALDNLRKTAFQAKKWGGWDDEVVEGLVTLIASASTEEQRSLLNTILNRIEVPSHHAEGGEEARCEEIKNTSSHVQALLNQLMDRLGLGAPEDFRLPVQEAVDWIPAVSALEPRELDDGIKKAFSPPPSELPVVLDELGARARQGAFGMTEALAIRALSDIELDSELDWQGLINILQNRLSANAQYDEEELRAMISALLYLEPIDEAAGNSLEQLATNWFLFYHLFYANSREAVATILLPLLINNPTGQQLSHGGAANQGLQKFRNFLQNPQEVDLQEMAEILMELVRRGSITFSVKNLIRVAKKNSQAKELVVALLDTAEKAHPREALSPDILLEHSDDLSELLGEEVLEEKYREYRRQVIKRALEKGFALDLLSAYRRILNAAEEPQLKRFTDFINAGVRGLQRDDWLSFMEEGSASNILVLLKELKKRGCPAKPNYRLADAIEEAAVSLLQEQKDAAHNPKVVRDYLEFLDEDARMNLSARLVRRLPELFSEHANKWADEFLEAVGDEILSAARDVKAEDLKDLLLIWLPPALEGSSKKELEWFAGLLEKLQERIPELEGEVREEAVNRVQEAQGSAMDEEIQKILNKILKYLLP